MRRWTRLDDVPAMRQAKLLLARRSELLHSDGPAATEDVRQSWQRLDELAKSAQAQFPLSDSAVTDLRADLQRRVLALYEAEVSAHSALATTLGG